jgi:protease-4
MELLGIDVEEMYLAGLLSKLHLKADFLQVGKYKGAEEPLTRTGPSPEWSQNIEALLSDIYEQAIDQIGAARHLTHEQVEKAFGDCLAMSDEDYVKRGLVDQLVDRDMKEATGPAFGDEFTWDTDMGQVSIATSMDNPFAFFKLLFQEGRPQITRPTIALVHAYGVIHSGDGADSLAPSAGLFGGPSIGSRTFIKALGEARDNEKIQGVVIRIDSPGGSALASEMIWQAIRQVSEKKPVYISVGSMAASGGYYLASAGQQVYASPNSIVGSIGVVGGKLVLGDFYNWIGVGVTRRSRGPMADAFNSVEPFTVEQKAELSKAFERIYDQFTQRVKAGRGKHVKSIEDVAQGRLFSGRQALANGLVDKIGGVDKALDDMAKKLKLEAGKYDVIDMPEPMTLPDFLDQFFGADDMAPATPGFAGVMGKLGEQGQIIGAVRQLLGERAWSQVQPVLSGMLLLQSEHVLTLMPTAIVIK